MKNVKIYQEAPIPLNEKERLESLYKLNLLDTPKEERFDRITKLALSLFKVPISTITLVDSQREWFKSCQGLPNKEGQRAISFCGHAMLAKNTFVIPDTQKDPRFAKNPMVIGKPYIRFYAAIPLKAADGTRIGAFCLKDYKPRKFSSQKIDLLKSLSTWVEIELNIYELSRALEARRNAENKLSELNEILRLLNKILRHDLLNYLTVIKGNLELFIKGRMNEEYLQDILLASDKSVSLIKQMGKLEPAVSTGTNLKPYNIRNIVNTISKLFPSLEFNISGKGMVLADEALISIIDNLISNAYIHGKSRKIKIEIKNKNNFVEISVADYGCGIPEKIKSKLFTEGVKYGKTGHMGLGLYIVKKTVLRYGGEISVKDNKPKGTVFVIKLINALS